MIKEKKEETPKKETTASEDWAAYAKS